MDGVGSGLFAAAVAVTFCAWLFGILESIGMWRFWPWVYRSGWRVIQEDGRAPPPGRPGPVTVDLPEVRAKAVAPDVVLFRAPFPWSGSFRTPFPVKASLILSGHGARTVGRIPVASVVFFVAFLAAWNVGAFVCAPGAPTLVSAAFAFLGWVVAAAFLAFSLPVELRRIRAARDALVAHLGRAPSDRARHGPEGSAPDAGKDVTTSGPAGR